MENTKIIYVVIVIRVVHQILTLLLLTDPPGLPGGPVVRAFTFQCWGCINVWRNIHALLG